MLYDLPQNILSLIYQYDYTYRRVFNLCLLELELYFQHHKVLRNVILSFKQDKLLFKYYVNDNIRVLLK